MKGFAYKRSIANTYQAHRSFDNELFKHRKRPKKGKFILAFLFGVAALGGVGWLTTRPFMFLTSIEVQGTETIDPYILSTQVTNALENDKLLGVSRLHILRRQDQTIHESLASHSFASIHVQKQNRRVTITVQEQAQGGLIHANNIWMLYSLTGEYVRDLSVEETTYIESTINGTSTEKALFYRDTPFIEFSNQNIVPAKKEQIFVQIKRMHDELIAYGHRPIMHIISNEQMLWAEARMREGETILYDLQRETATQIEQYLTIKKELRNGATPIHVIDVRFEGRVYTR